MKLLDEHQAARKALFKYFGYVEDWVVYPFDDARNYYWRCDGDSVIFCDDPKVEPGNHYSNEVYRQRFLPKWIYQGEDYTMIVVDTRTDGNKFLQIFDNSKMLTEEAAERLREY